MRPNGDIAHPDPDEILHHVRESQRHWQATAERLARQRDHYAVEADLLEQENHDLRRAAQRYRDLVEDSPWFDPPHGVPGYDERLAELDALLDPPDPDEHPNPDVARPGDWETAAAGHRDTDSASQVTG